MLVEKPMAASLAEADRLIAAAEARGTLLATGHTERFNPAVAAALPLVSSPRFIEIHRLGTFPERSLDIDVIFDLMIHDLDILLARGRVRSGVGRGGRRERADAARRHRQRAPAVCVRLHRQPDRQPDQPGPRAQGALLSARFLRLDRLRGAGGRGVPTGCPERRTSRVIQGGRMDVPTDEPLRRELADFVDAVRTQPPAGGHRARRPRRAGAGDAHRRRSCDDRIIRFRHAPRARDRRRSPVGRRDHARSRMRPTSCRSACSPTRCAGGCTAHR